MRRDDRAGRIGVPAMVHASPMGDMSRRSFISRGGDDSSVAAFSMLSKTFGVLAQQAGQAEALAQARASKEADAAAAEMKAQQAGIDRLSGAAAGLRFLAEVEEKSRLGEWGLDTALEQAQALMAGGGSSKEFNATLSPFTLKALELAQQNELGRRLEEANNSFLALARQGFANIHAAYDPDKPEEYIQARTELYNQRHTLGIPGAAINELEMTSLVTQAKKYAESDPAKAMQLIALAEQQRPDGSPSVAASAVNGYSTLEVLREEVSGKILSSSKREQADAMSTLKESSKDAFIIDSIALSRLEDPEAVKQWAVSNIDNLSPKELEAKYGDHVLDFLNVIDRAKSSQKPEGNAEALAELSEGIQRGTVEWEDVKRDKRLSEPQRAQLFSTMKDLTQKTQLGYLSDAQLAGKLLSDLEGAWGESVYKSPWMGSKQIEPGKPPLITPEGLFYQGELFKRLRQLDPTLDVNKSNQEKQGIAFDLRNEVLSGKFRWADHSGRLQEPAPELKLSEKVKEGYAFTEQDITGLGKAFNDGGVGRVKDVYGLDLFTLDPANQKRIGAEAQRQKAELDALKANSLTNRFLENIGTMYGESGMILVP